MISRPSQFGYQSLMHPDMLLASHGAADAYDLKHALAALDMPEAPEPESERGRAIIFLGKYLEDMPRPTDEPRTV